MNALIYSLTLAVSLVSAGITTAHAQTAPTDKASAKAERRVQGAQAARSFEAGDSRANPMGQAGVPRAERKAAGKDRRTEGAVASKAFQPGEGNGQPLATAKLPRAERAEAHAQRRAEMRTANKNGQIPSYGEGAGSQ